ncbi:DUF7800 domain-containing protein [Williamsia sterculiae]|uniref:PhoD-like phosphatase n=1 Tax=Williamsia sterculiae TaxID=1344003 RepID=A0A1N7HBX7_9NOCA|nr:alkaline phosphatase D family protein [Williamsia sterculiae]SIS22376.1 PhoD-like phosphatase [Williamsia sterculiae]
MNDPSDVAPSLILGPIVRYVDEHRATMWFETSRPATVVVSTATAAAVEEQTWDVHGHHYAMLILEGLPAGTEVSYAVDLRCGEITQRVWPEAGDSAVIATLSTSTPVRMAFGSCRRGDGYESETLEEIGADALVGLSHRVRGQRSYEWPQLLLLLGDQVYADDPSPHVLEKLHAARAAEHVVEAHSDDVFDEICSFEEYTWLYHESWGSPQVRWLMATIPSAMILDDHDLRDDWNSSADWRREVTATSWWRDRVIGAFSSYWVYQHLGNLSPDELATEPLYAAVRTAGSGSEREELLRDFALRADDEPASARWSFHRDLGDTRLIMIDSRCSRQLDPANRLMVDEREWQWVRDQALDGDIRHVVFGTSLPFLMLPALHHLEQWNEAVAQGAWGGLMAKLGEKLRLALDLEHWAAFGRSFEHMVDLVRELLDRPRPPAGIYWLSGDVHCSYVAEASLDDRPAPATSLYQLTMSPFRNPLERPIRLVNRVAVRGRVSGTLRRLSRRAHVPDTAMTWQAAAGPWFDNGVMVLTISGDDASVQVWHAHLVEPDDQRLHQTATLALTP